MKIIQFKLEAIFLDLNNLTYAGLSSSPNCRFFVRQESRDLFATLSKEAFVLVEGPPGVGKSLSVWIWACHESGSHSLTWFTMILRRFAFVY